MLFCFFFFYFAHKIYICRQVTQFPLLANLVTLQNFPRVCFRIFYELDELDKNLNQTCLIDSLKPKTYFRVFFFSLFLAQRQAQEIRLRSWTVLSLRYTLFLWFLIRVIQVKPAGFRGDYAAPVTDSGKSRQIVSFKLRDWEITIKPCKKPFFLPCIVCDFLALSCFV